MIEFPKDLILRNIGGSDDALAVSIQDEMNRRIGGELKIDMGFAAVSNGAASTSTARIPTVASMKKTLAEIDEFFSRAASPAPQMLAPPPMSQAEIGQLIGVRMHIMSEAMLPRDPVRVHKRQRWDRSGKYHLRIQKKWNKRFGVVVREVAYVSDAGKTLYITQAAFDRLQKELA